MITDDIKQAFPDANAPDVGSYYSEHIAAWKKIYEGKPPWRRVKKTGLYAKGDREKKQLNVANALCDKFTSLLFAEQVDITVSVDTYQEYIDGCLNACGFWSYIQGLLSVAFALGGGAFKVYVKDKKPRIEYVHADRFAPIEWDGRRITGCVISTVSVRNGKRYTLLERHSPGKVAYKLYRSESSAVLGQEVPIAEMYPGIKDENDYKTDVPMFIYFAPDVSNNAEYDTPLGMSIYANAVDTIEAIDTAFDSFSREVVLGRKRIIVPAESIQTTIDTKTGKLVQYFDSDDEAFVALKSPDDGALKIADNTLTLRIQEHVDAIIALLNILCMQTGLSAGSLSFDSVQGIKTATEVISQDNVTQQTIRGNKNLLVEAIEALCRALIAAGVYTGELKPQEYDIVVSFRDNILIDDNTMIDNNIKLVQAGLKSKIKAVMEVQKCDEKTAQEELDRIAKEQSVTGLAVDDLMGGDEIDTDSQIDGVSTGAVIEDAEDVAGKTLNGAQTQPLIAIIAQYQSGALSIGQAVNIISASIGVSKEEAKRIIEGAE